MTDVSVHESDRYRYWVTDKDEGGVMVRFKSNDATEAIQKAVDISGGKVVLRRGVYHDVCFDVAWAKKLGFDVSIEGE